MLELGNKFIEGDGFLLPLISSPAHIELKEGNKTENFFPFSYLWVQKSVTFYDATKRGTFKEFSTLGQEGRSKLVASSFLMVQ